MKKGIIYNLKNTFFDILDMFVGICTWTSYIFAMFEWQKAFLNIKSFT